MAGRKLAVNTTVIDDEGRGHTYAAGEVVPAEVAKRITNPKAWGSGAGEDEADPESSGSGNSYAGLKVDELKAEIESRNVDREDDAKLSTEGKKADLIAVLEADDQAAGDNEQ